MHKILSNNSHRSAIVYQKGFLKIKINHQGLMANHFDRFVKQTGDHG